MANKVSVIKIVFIFVLFFLGRTLRGLLTRTFRSSLCLVGQTCPILVSHGVPPYINFAIEASATNSARERFDTRVSTHVGEHVGRLAKNLPALLALKGLLTCMHERVFFHVRLAEEFLVAVATRVWFEIRVNELMRRKTGGPFKFLATNLTFVDFSGHRFTQTHWGIVDCGNWFSIWH